MFLSIACKFNYIFYNIATELGLFIKKATSERNGYMPYWRLSAQLLVQKYFFFWELTQYF